MRDDESTRTSAERTRGSPRCSRRVVIAAAATGFAGCTSGVLADPSFPDADVVAAPDGDLVFEPEELTVSVGETVRWGFASGGHNVSCRPEDDEKVVVPEGAEPFASYGPQDDPEVTLVSRGGTYEHIFEVPGQYTYVCIPHVDSGMVGTVRVE